MLPGLFLKQGRRHGASKSYKRAAAAACEHKGHRSGLLSVEFVHQYRAQYRGTCPSSSEVAAIRATF
eukprot:6742263-Prymnesium_polylepis.1